MDVMLEIEKYAERQRTLAKRLLGEDVPAVEDACQEARKDVLRRSRANKEPIEVFWPYLRKATIHVCYRELRRRYREQVARTGDPFRYVIAEAPDPAIAAMLADILLTSDRIIRKHFGPLDVQIFRLRFHDGLPISAIATQLGVSVSAVKKHQRAMLAVLRKTLDADGRHPLAQG